MRKVIGVTGGLGSGKSTVMNLIKEKGYQVINLDDLSHQVMLDKRYQISKKIAETFGVQYVKNGEIDRKMLGKLVFDDEEKRHLLEDIMHPIIKKKLIKMLDNMEGIVFVEVPLLFETDFYKLCDKTILVYTTFDNQIHRVMNRDGLDFPTAIKRIRTQMPLDEKLDLADYAIDNRYQEYDLGFQVQKVLERVGD